MSRKAQAFWGLLALLLAGISGCGVYLFFDRLTTTVTLPVPNRIISAGTLIAPHMLAEREVPRALLDEPVYTSWEQLAGTVAQVTLQPGMVVYHAFAVPPAQYRLVDDPTLVVAALPVDPARAVGGQIQPGHSIDLWQLPLRRQGLQEAAAPVTPTLVLTQVLVVDVRGAAGQAVARQPQAVPGEPARQAGTQPPQTLPLQILTVALPVSQTATLMEVIAADQSHTALLWVALAPLVRPSLPESPAAASLLPGKALPEPLLPLPAPTLPAVTTDVTPLPSDTLREIRGTDGEPLLVRDAPGGRVVGELPDGTSVVVLQGPVLDSTGELWYRITTEDTAAEVGWVPERSLTGGGKQP